MADRQVVPEEEESEDDEIDSNWNDNNWVSERENRAAGKEDGEVQFYKQVQKIKIKNKDKTFLTDLGLKQHRVCTAV